MERSNSPLSYNYLVEISADGHLLPVLLRHFRQGEHLLVLYIAFFPFTVIDSDIIRYVPRQFFMDNALLSITLMPHSSEMPCPPKSSTLSDNKLPPSSPTPPSTMTSPPPTHC
ncbi:hypothetical protein TIFTF001_011512 [Ficus carica]|uniref:Uncharacterized protein n=1 Tax=Ficus carica TaxID=3494 RepID=A0AA88D4A5_FICCA|nr:hypothetical protein TIFTF001_011512 [Ficus carica]